MKINRLKGLQAGYKSPGYKENGREEKGDERKYGWEFKRSNAY